MATRARVCACVVALGDEPFLPLVVQSIYPHVQRVFFGVNATRFSDGTPAPDLVDTIIMHITALPDPEGKLEVVRLDIRGETAVRNALLAHAQSCGYTWAFILDCDEILDTRDAARLVHDCPQWGDPCVVRVSIRHYWRSMKYTVISNKSYAPVVFMHTSMKFHEFRNVLSAKRTRVLRDILLHHLGFARPPSNMQTRIGLNSHGGSVVDGWFDHWLNDDPLTLQNCHPQWPTEFRYVVMSDKTQLPAALAELFSSVT